jgi:hypothetical protein
MNPEVLDWLRETGGTATIVIGALWLFKDHLYVSFGQPPAGVRFKHPADSTEARQDETSPALSPPGEGETRQRR